MQPIIQVRALNLMRINCKNLIAWKKLCMLILATSEKNAHLCGVTPRRKIETTKIGLENSLAKRRRNGPMNTNIG